MMKLKVYIKDRFFWKNFAVAIAALSAAATLLTAPFDLDCIKSFWLYGVIGAVVVLAGSAWYAYWQTCSKPKVSFDLSSELNLNIYEGDLFEQKGIICIPVNEYFDTHVGDGVIDKGSVHGIFINKFFKGRVAELEERIKAKLPSNASEYEVHKRRLSNCPDKRYKLGTCIDLREGENTYVLFALTHFDDKDIASVSRAEYTEVVWKLMNHLSSMAEATPVFMPLFGTRLSRMRRTPQRILLHLVNTVDFDDTCVLPGGLNIVIKSLKDLNVNLTTLEYIVKNGITKNEQ